MPPKHIGGVIRPDVVHQARMARQLAEAIQVTWKWYDEGQGLVQWDFTNPGMDPATCILLRNGYYFGGAFWPVYLANPAFGTVWATELAPLVDNGVTNNTAPMGLLQFDDGARQVVFLFTIAPGQTWSMLEGGFSAVSPPEIQAAPIVALQGAGEFCVGYDPQQVLDWDLQTGTALQGYSPNPSTFTTVLVTAAGTPDIRLFPGDSAVDGPCGPTPTPSCTDLLKQAVVELEAGEIANGIEDLFRGIECLIMQDVISWEAAVTRILHHRKT